MREAVAQYDGYCGSGAMMKKLMKKISQYD